DFVDLAEQWGGSLAQSLDTHSRDYQVQRRMEKQLTVRLDSLARTVGPFLVRNLAITGSDFNLTEGSDLAIIFRVTNRALVGGSRGPVIEEAREEFGEELTEKTEEDHGIKIDSVTTPLREVSSYRASFGDYVVLCNSPVGLRRILDVHQGRAPALADAPDY